jgi:hypothetical protein
MSPKPGPVYAPVHGQPQKRKVVSVADDSLDSLVQAASAPSLATLFGKAKDAGLIEGGLSNYGEGAPQGAAAS